MGIGIPQFLGPFSGFHRKHARLADEQHTNVLVLDGGWQLLFQLGQGNASCLCDVDLGKFCRIAHVYQHGLFTVQPTNGFIQINTLVANISRKLRKQQQGRSP